VCACDGEQWEPISGGGGGGQVCCDSTIGRSIDKAVDGWMSDAEAVDGAGSA